jgi:hypothetical protein
VAVFEAYLGVLLSMHKDCGPVWQWQELAARPGPMAPTMMHALEQTARAEAERYRPTLFDKLFGLEKKRRADLANALVEMQAADTRAFTEAQARYVRDREVFNWERDVARSVLRGDPAAYRAVLRQVDPLREVLESGMNVTVESMAREEGILRCDVHDKRVMPHEEKSVTARGLISVKPMSASRYWATFQDYVCGCLLRVSRETFAILPLRQVTVHVTTPAIDTSTGHDTRVTILSARVPRDRAMTLRYDQLDPSDSLRNFDHRMKFRKTAGFAAVEPISPDEIFVTSSVSSR